MARYGATATADTRGIELTKERYSMDEKTQARIKKLQALAERGVGGEKETAARNREQRGLIYGEYGKR